MESSEREMEAWRLAEDKRREPKQNMSLTIIEFSMLREAMRSCRKTNLRKNPSAFQAKPFFQNEENFKIIEEKLRFYLTMDCIKK